jgi:type VI secretion system secreted protein Hcp
MAVDMFFKIGDIKGESKDSKHKDEIDVLSWSWAVNQHGSSGYGGGGGTGKVQATDVTFVKRLDLSSPNLFESCCNGKHYPEAKLTVRKAGEHPLENLIVTLTDVLVSGYSPGASHGNEEPTENVTLNFAKATLKYVPQNEKGAGEGANEKGWDFKQNKKV